MSESELYKKLGILTKDRNRWEENIPLVSSLLSHESVKIQAKALWLLGEMGLEFPDLIRDTVPTIALFCDSTEPLLRERAVNALGRIGRGNYQLIEPYWKGLFRFASDTDAKVRLCFIWASENIATNTPDIYEWKHRKSSVSSENAGRSSSGLMWSSCNRYLKRMTTVSLGSTAWVQSKLHVRSRSGIPALDHRSCDRNGNIILSCRDSKTHDNHGNR